MKIVKNNFFGFEVFDVEKKECLSIILNKIWINKLGNSDFVSYVGENNNLEKETFFIQLYRILDS